MIPVHAPEPGIKCYDVPFVIQYGTPISTHRPQPGLVINGPAPVVRVGRFLGIRLPGVFIRNSDTLTINTQISVEGYVLTKGARVLSISNNVLKALRSTAL